MNAELTIQFAAGILNGTIIAVLLRRWTVWKAKARTANNLLNDALEETRQVRSECVRLECRLIHYQTVAMAYSEDLRVLAKEMQKDAGCAAPTPTKNYLDYLQMLNNWGVVLNPYHAAAAQSDRHADH